MRSARGAAIGLALGSASLLALSASAQEAGTLPAVEPNQPQLTEPVPALSAPPAEAPAPEAAAPPSPADLLRVAIAAKLPDLGEIAPRLPRREREALAAFYAAGGPLWIADGAWTPAAKAVMQRLKAADEDGLDPADYPLPAASLKSGAEPEWAEAELKLSAAAVLYARDARGGRIDPTRLSNLITPKLELPQPEQVLAALREAADPAAALQAYNPSHPGYRALKARLAELRATRRSTAPVARVPVGPALKVGMRDPRVPLIRTSLKLGPASGDQTAYDEQVASAVAAFQREKGLRASGILNAQTVAALGGGPSPAHVEGDLIANMERWRWLPADLGERHILVNLPEYRLRLIRHGQTVHQARVIVGKAESPTPIFSDEMEYVIVNPSWTVPPSILKNEFLPAMAADPYYAERKGYKVIRRGGQISIQQPPGERNALGYVKFIFPNEHAVYLHDTPNRNLFSAERRAFSHGCVRVDQPFRLAEAILATESAWREDRLRGLIGKGERYIRVRDPLPVHLAHFTLAVDEQGQMRSFDDLYGIHRKVRAALGFQG